MTEDAYVVIRNVYVDECEWLDEPILAGTIVYRYYGATYGCIGDGVAVTEIPDQVPSFELPWDSLQKVSCLEGKHAWREVDLIGCELCGEHYGLECTECYDVVDLTFKDDPRITPV